MYDLNFSMLRAMPSSLPSKSKLRIPSLREDPRGQPNFGTSADVAQFFSKHAHVVILTGAGLSTHSGIPAYRDEGGAWLRRTPIFYQDFIHCPIARRRYWARSYFGWDHVAKAKPNQGHQALARLESAGYIKTVITQNVDGLHERAGSQSLIEVHGQLGRVKCLDCGAQYQRDTIQAHLKKLNTRWTADVLNHNPDGDVDLDEAAYPDFKVADCMHCSGRLKPEVVFFGESVPKQTTKAVDDAIKACDGLLIIGSSLIVMSGYRIVKQVHGMGKPVIAINRGITRADDLLNFKVDNDCIQTIADVEATLH